MPDLSLVQKIAIWVVPVLLGITVHEVAHGWIARNQRADLTTVFALFISILFNYSNLIYH